MTFARHLVVVVLIVVAVAASSAAQHKKPAAKQQEQKAPFRLFNPDTMAKPAATYSHVAEVNDGKLVFISGQVAIDSSGNPVGKDDFAAQVKQIFENLKAAVEATGGEFQNIVKLNFYCAESVDPEQIPVLRQIRDKYINVANPPTSTFVVVKRLARPEWMLEVEAVAVVKK